MASTSNGFLYVAETAAPSKTRVDATHSKNLAGEMRTEKVYSLVRTRTSGWLVDATGGKFGSERRLASEKKVGLSRRWGSKWAVLPVHVGRFATL